MSTNVGAVDFELLLNSNPFNKGIQTAGNTIQKSGIEGMLGKIGKAALAAFSVKAVVDFTKSCLELGSNLAEVQNVVDVTFGNLNSEVDEFAKNAIDQFGLGQTVTKKYVGTFGAMAKAFNFNNQAALEMSKTLTGLVGDVASFYNLSSDEAFTKLKSVFTGETETLKDLGIVMTQNALDQYALANGYGKTTSAMSEQEKTALRYQFVLDKLSLAQGDFARTSDSWANQTRVLSLRFDELKATLGQGFINLFTPIVQGINWVISKLQVLADAFKSFTEFITGNKSDSSGGVGSIATDLTDVTSSADTASDAVSGIGSSAKKSAKDMKSLASFDTANILKSNSNEKSESSGGSAGLDFGNSLTDTMQKANSEMDSFMTKASELVDIFKQGFSEGFGTFDFNSITNAIESIKNNLSDIFSSPEVTNAASNWINSLITDLGKTAGSIASISLSIADNLIGGINKYLEQNKQNVQEHIVRLFDISSKSHEISGNISTAIADIWTVLRSDTAKQITADLISIFTDAVLGTIEVVGTLVNDLVYIFTQPFIENKDLIKETIEGMLEPISSVLNTIKNGVQDTFSKFWEVYNTYIAPAVENIKNGFSSILNTILTVWNENLKPIFDEWAIKFDTLWKEHIQPMIDAFLVLIGKLVNAVSELWNTWLVPIINWIVENVVPVITPILETIGNTVGAVFASIMDVLKGLWDALGGLIDFIAGVFTGDWDKAWQGIGTLFTGLWEAIKSVFSGIWEAIKGTVEAGINSISAIIQTVLNIISSIWSNIWNGMKNTVVSIFNGIWNAIRGVINSILGGIEGMANGVVNGINAVIKALNKLHFDIPDWVPVFGGNSFGFNIPQLSRVSLPRLAEGGYVKANTPQLAMIGDNRHQGEIVAPEDKLMSLYKQANKEMGVGNDTKVIQLLNRIIQLLELLSNQDFNLYIDGYELLKRLEKISKKKKFAKNGG